MKNLFFVVAGALIIMLSACGKGGDGLKVQNQSDTASSKANLLVGKWFYTTDTLRYYTNNTLDSTKAFNYFQTDNIVFNASATGTETRGSVSYNFSFSTSGSDIILTFPSEPGIQSIKVKTDGIRTLAAANYNIIAAIKQLTSTQMVLVFGSTKGTQTIDETVHFTKQ